MSDEIKDTLLGFATAGGVLVVLLIFGAPIVFSALIAPLAAIAAGVISSHLRDRRISVELESELNARFGEAERHFSERARPKDKIEEDSSRASTQPTGTELWRAQQKRKETDGGRLEEATSPEAERAEQETLSPTPSQTVIQPSGIELWRAQQIRKYKKEEEKLRAEQEFAQQLVSFVHRPRGERTRPSDIRADLADTREKETLISSYILKLEAIYGDSPTPEEARRLSRLTEQRRTLRDQASSYLRQLTYAQFSVWEKQHKAVRYGLGEKVNLSSSTDFRVWLDSRKRPDPQPFGVSHEGAEHFVAEWLRYLGEEGVEVTSFIGDGGVDVQTDEYCCQVKNYGEGGVTASEMRDLFGAATAAGKKPILFTSSRLTAPAEEFASATEIACVKYDSQDSVLVPLNEAGRNFLEQGHYE